MQSGEGSAGNDEQQPMMSAPGTAPKGEYALRPSISSTRASPAFRYRILTKAGIESVKRYKYSGCDLSLYYEYFASPLANWLTHNMTPVWLAPNVITLTGFVLVLVWHAVIFFHAPLMSEAMPSWVGFGAAATTFIYQTLDNMDGKQARRTYSSSAVGQLLDHGCDAIVTSLFTINSGVMLRAGGSALEQSKGAVFSGIFPYMFAIALTGVYLTQWEEFHTGSFRLDIINGPNEGILFMICLAIVQAVSSPDFSHTPIVSKYTPLDLVLGLTALAGAATNSAQLFRVWFNVRDKCKYFDKRSPRLIALWRLSPLVLIDAFVLVLAKEEAVAQSPYIFYWTVGLNFALLDILFSLRLLCDESPTLFPLHIWPMFFILVAHTWWPESRQYLSQTITVYFAISVVYFARKIFRLFWELCVALDIRMFRIVPRDGL